MLISDIHNSAAEKRPAMTLEALRAYELQSGLPDVVRFLVETGRVTIIESEKSHSSDAIRETTKKGTAEV